MITRQFIKTVQDNTKEREPFNRELLEYRQNEDLYPLIHDIGKSLEILEGIEFLGCSIEKNNKFFDNKAGITKEYNIEENRFKIIKMSFQLSHKSDTKKVELTLYYPELIDGQYFLINGCRYTPVLQLVDSECYSTNVGITLKTSLMPIKFVGEKAILADINNEINMKTKMIKLELFKNKINIFHYFFAKMGIDETLKYFKLANDNESYILIDEEPITDSCYSFKISSFNAYINVWKEWFDRDRDNNAIIIATLINAFKGKRNIEKINELEYWKRQLGSNFTKNNSSFLEKSQSIISSLERLLDDTTKRNLRIDPEDKEDVYAVLRWMMINYRDIYNIDNMNLANKRLRINEYLLYDLIRYFSKQVYRIINSKNMSIKKLNTVFSNIKKEFLIKSIARCDQVRYSNQVNTLDIFSNLKGTVGGRACATLV